MNSEIILRIPRLWSNSCCDHDESLCMRAHEGGVDTIRTHTYGETDSQSVVPEFEGSQESEGHNGHRRKPKATVVFLGPLDSLPKGRSIADAEPALPLRFFVPHLDRFDVRPWRALSAPANHRFDCVRVSFENGFHSSVCAVAHPPIDTEGKCLFVCGSPEVHALDMPTDDDMGSSSPLHGCP